LHPDGRQLFALSTQAAAYVATRLSAEVAFFGWTPTSTGLPAESEDPTFFTASAETWLVTAYVPVTDAPRRLQLCRPSWTCNDLELIDALTNRLIAYDLDGASVVNTARGLLMALNVQTGGPETAEIFLARPSGNPFSPQGRWTGSRLDEVSDPSRKDDDPALGPDGRVIVFEAHHPVGGDYDLWVSTRPDLQSPFSPPQLIAALNSTAGEGSPELAALDDGSLEIFFTSSRATPTAVYHSRCQLETP
jgi:hypothetical protein